MNVRVVEYPSIFPTSDSRSSVSMHDKYILCVLSRRLLWNREPNGTRYFNNTYSNDLTIKSISLHDMTSGFHRQKYKKLRRRQVRVFYLRFFVVYSLSRIVSSTVRDDAIKFTVNTTILLQGDGTFEVNAGEVVSRRAV